MKRTLLTLAIALLATTAFAADLPAQTIPFPTKAPASGCTTTNCSGWELGVTLMGVGENLNVLGNGLQGSLFAGGGGLGLNAGYQFWNGQYYFAFEGFGTYDPTNNAAGGKYLFGTMLQVGMGLQGLLGAPAAPTTPSQSPVALTVPAQLASALASPFLEVGPRWRPWGTGWASGAGFDFVLASGWNAKIAYDYAQYKGAVVPSENIVRIELNKKF